MTTNTDTDANTRTDTDTDPHHRDSTTVLFETGPSAKPVAVKLGVVAISGAIILGYLLMSPESLGNPETTRIATYVVAIIGLLIVLRYVIRIYLLKRYRYRITEDAIQWTYTLLYRTRARELPFSQLRGYDYTQDRIQTLLGFGTVEFLTGGTNQSLGFLAYENVAQPEEIRHIIREQMQDSK
jgi:uncharacterized membrane protein YdbT with pleckstrin-like domain